MRCGKHIIPENRVERFLILVAAERLPRVSVSPWLLRHLNRDENYTTAVSVDPGGGGIRNVITTEPRRI